MYSQNNEELNLYNGAGMGDVFSCRTLIYLLGQKYKINFYHRHKDKLLDDMRDEVNEYTFMLDRFNVYEKSTTYGDINTWIGVKKGSYLQINNTGRGSAENFFYFFKDICDEYNIEFNWDMLYDYLPRIEYEKLSYSDSIKETMGYLGKKFKKVIFWSNGDTQSGQSTNFDMSPYIHQAAKEFPTYLHIHTTSIDDQWKEYNIISSSSIIGKDLDLPSLSYVSTFCNTIIGRDSGPYHYSLTKENIMDENKTFICFTFYPDSGRWYSGGKAKFYLSDGRNPEMIWYQIKNNI